MVNRLFNHMNRLVNISEAEFESCIGFFEMRKYRKHQYILQEGDVSRNETFVLKGCARTYEIDDKGTEHVIQFGPEDWWVGDLYSFFTEKPSKCNIDCLEDCEVLQITKQKELQMFDLVPKTERYFRLLIQNAYIASINRITANMSRSAADRYTDFLLRYPHIEQRVPDKQIASYLGITAPSLSRIRASIATGKV